MSITINGNGTITGYTPPIADGSITATKLAANAVTTTAIADSAVTPVKSTITGGITMYDEWRRSTNGSGTGTITNDWERNDSSWFAQLGTGMTQSSGVFTFPSTGIYIVHYHVMGYRNGDSPFFGANLYVSTDSGSNWTTVVYSRNSNNADGDAYATAYGHSSIDVTNASTYRVKLVIDTAGTWTWRGNTTFNESFMTFMKAGET